jgi:hypothetical protein
MGGVDPVLEGAQELDRRSRCDIVVRVKALQKWF